jgi:predicted TPR repeat methyltransferase
MDAAHGRKQPPMVALLIIFDAYAERFDGVRQ